ncbi:D-alanine aminotransferase [Halorhodospira halochloris]|uniref:Aminodeoxychorismate lyase n=1 Tax=Halorhodospira halochloris TaxID=1052 RepID=A0A110B4C3_HALHR|nr:D-amino acid aminotransferase [Halorhodospira halochloris]MBK1650990.1 D-amino acid aminotransferase [Halorhodospira halochloris]MCG5547332.1 D-amino acid aminotransferase [Halorhodospira halochloris]BAU56500.1 D-alanine aminotransferase [Halorhodospira halochloris]
MPEHSICYLNGRMLPLDQAHISPLDRGFLFADSVYEVIPVYAGKPFLLEAHLQRLHSSLDAIRMSNPHSYADWEDILTRLCSLNGGGDLALYLQITRGSPVQRRHEFPADGNQPTIFAMVSELPSPTNHGLKAITLEDTRWARCDIKSTALLANVLLRQSATDNGADEAILHRNGLVTEGAASSLFIVKDRHLSTPQLNHDVLPGVTRNAILALAEQYGLPHSCREIHIDELSNADEVWLTSSTKEVAPVIEIDGHPICEGRPGPIHESMRLWLDKLKEES